MAVSKDAGPVAVIAAGPVAVFATEPVAEIAGARMATSSNDPIKTNLSNFLRSAG